MGTFAPSRCNSHPLEFPLTPSLRPSFRAPQVFRKPEAPREPLVVDSSSLPGFTFPMWKAESVAATKKCPLHQVNLKFERKHFCTVGTLFPATGVPVLLIKFVVFRTWWSDQSSGTSPSSLGSPGGSKEEKIEN